MLCILILVKPGLPPADFLSVNCEKNLFSVVRGLAPHSFLANSFLLLKAIYWFTFVMSNPLCTEDRNVVYIVRHAGISRVPELEPVS